MIAFVLLIFFIIVLMQQQKESFNPWKTAQELRPFRSAKAGDRINPWTRGYNYPFAGGRLYQF